MTGYDLESLHSTPCLTLPDAVKCIKSSGTATTGCLMCFQPSPAVTASKQWEDASEQSRRYAHSSYYLCFSTSGSIKKRDLCLDEGLGENPNMQRLGSHEGELPKKLWNMGSYLKLASQFERKHINWFMLCQLPG